MMDCKAALQEADGDMEKATDILRKKGIAKADKRSDRSASQGMVVIETASGGRDAAMIELNCETDFVAKNEDFIALARDLARHALAQAPLGVFPGSAIDEQGFRGATVGQAVKEVSGKTGEAMALKRVARFAQPAGMVASYLHFTGQVGVLIDLEGPAGDALVAVSRELGLHIASMDPIAVDESGSTPRWWRASAGSPRNRWRRREAGEHPRQDRGRQSPEVHRRAHPAGPALREGRQEGGCRDHQGGRQGGRRAHHGEALCPVQGG